MFIYAIIRYRRSQKTTEDQRCLVKSFEWCILYTLLFFTGQIIIKVLWQFKITKPGPFILGLLLGVPCNFWWRNSFQKWHEQNILAEEEAQPTSEMVDPKSNQIV